MLTTSPSSNLHGRVTLPGDKSMSHRGALFSALAVGESIIDNFLDAGVTRRMLEALTDLGVGWELDGTRLRVRGSGLAGLKSPAGPIDCGNSGTTMRLLAGALAASGLPAVLDGSQGLRKRPMDRIVGPLREMGVRVEAEDGRAPLAFSAGNLPLSPPDRFNLQMPSAQVKSCLLLAGLSADRPVRILEPGISRDHTERMLSRMGVVVRSTRSASEAGSVVCETVLEPPAVLEPFGVSLPGDFSSAAFLIAAALVCPGSEIVLEGVGLNPTRTGILDALELMGADVEVTQAGEAGREPYGDLRIRHGRLRGVSIDGRLVARMIDEFPALAAAAVYAEGPTTVSGAAELRFKESDRIRALCTQLQAIGVRAEERPDGFVIPGGGSPAGGRVHPNGDHRIAMALSVAGLGAAGAVEVEEAEIIGESFPGFAESLRRLGGKVDI